MNKQNILKAIELAENPGGCKYFSEGKPSCVVGQLFVIEGAKEEEFKECNYTGIGSTDSVLSSVMHYLDGYSIDLLDDLQSMWDCDLGPEEDLDERKARMVELAINYGG